MLLLKNSLIFVHYTEKLKKAYDNESSPDESASQNNG